MGFAARAITNRYEATISAIQDPPQTAARVFEPQHEEERARHFAQPAPDGAKTADASLGIVEKGLGFPRERRIKQGRDFRRIKTEGKRLASGCLVANWAASEQAESRLGVVTSRAVGNAVRRNRARRLLREAFRVHQLDLSRPVDMVLVARPSIVGKEFQEVERDLLAALRRGGLLKNSL